MSSQKAKIENPGLLIIMLLLFCLSFGLISYGILKIRNTSSVETSKSASEIAKKSDQDGESLSKYFEGKQDISSDSGTNDYYLQTDPFKDTCSTGGGGNTPFVVSGTVCYR